MPGSFPPDVIVLDSEALIHVRMARGKKDPQIVQAKSYRLADDTFVPAVVTPQLTNEASLADVLRRLRLESGRWDRASLLLRSLAPSIGRTDTWLGIYHRRMKARLGPAGANTATAHKLATVIYHLLKYKEDYLDVDRILYEEKFRRCRLTRLRKQAEELGFQLTESPKAA